MKSYRESDYALNKYSPNIVYKFSDKTVEVTEEDYLKQNPNKTVEDFAKLKALSDENYHESDLVDTKYRRKKLSIHSLEEGAGLGVDSFVDKLYEDEEKHKALLAAKELLDNGKLTKVQKRRFILHYFQNLSTRKIAAMEGVSHIAVFKSITLANEKLKNIFYK